MVRVIKKLALCSIPFLVAALVSCNSNILTDADSIKDSGSDAARSATNARTVTFNCQDAASGSTDTLIVRKVTGSETMVGTLPSDPVKTGYVFAGWWTATNGGGTAFLADTIVTADITVYARWTTVPVHLVSFDTTGGSQVSVRKVTDGETFKSPGNPDKKGYLFGGWFRESTCATPWNFDTDRVRQDTVLYAKWDSYTWTVTFVDRANPDYAEKSTVTSPATATGTLPSPKANGSKYFAGWWTGENGTGTQLTTSTAITADLSVYAAWSVTQVYTIAFDAQGGTPVGSQSVAAGKKPATPDETTKDGYTFKGWYSAPNGKGSSFSASNPVSANATWYAFWGTYSYVVTFECDDADIPADPAKITVETPATTVTALPSVQPAKTGYLFGGWFTGDNGDGYEFTETTPVTSSTTVHAAWKSYGYTVSFSTGSGTAATMSVNSPNTSLGAFPDDPVRTSYLFGGWYTKPDGEGTRINTTTAITADTTVYAKWIKACTVTFSANGGSGSMATQTLAIGESAQLKANAFNRPGFTFTGWALSSYGTSVYPDNWHLIPNSSSLTLYATWTINTYAISFNANGGTGKVNDIAMEYGKITTLNPNKFSKQGYEFAGWSTSPTGAVEYANLAVYTMGATNVTMYAVWKYSASASETMFIAKAVRRQVTIAGFSNEWDPESASVMMPNLVSGMPVIAIDTSMFDKAAKLESIGIDPDNALFVSKDGVLFSKDMTTLYRYPAGKKDSSYAIPQTVTTIADGAFNSAWNLSTIKLATATPPNLGHAAITPASVNFTIAVPKGSADAYRKAPAWSVFADSIR